MSEQFNGYYSVVPASVRDDLDLRPTAKVLYIELSALVQNKGFCWASNKYLADKIALSEKTVEGLLKQLEDHGHIQREITQKGLEETPGIRQIWLVDPIASRFGTPLPRKGSSPHQKGEPPLKKRNVHIKEKHNTNIPPNPPEGDAPESAKKSRFTPPSAEEVAAYCRQRNNGIDAQAFCDHYAANGWKRGTTKIADWKACVRTWEGRRKESTPAASPAHSARVPTGTIIIDGEEVNVYE